MSTNHYDDNLLTAMAINACPEIDIHEHTNW